MRWKASSLFLFCFCHTRALSPCPAATAGLVRAFYRMNAGLTPYYIKIKRATTSRGHAGRRSHTLTPVVEVNVLTHETCPARSAHAPASQAS